MVLQAKMHDVKIIKSVVQLSLLVTFCQFWSFFIWWPFILLKLPIGSLWIFISWKTCLQSRQIAWTIYYEINSSLIWSRIFRKKYFLILYFPVVSFSYLCHSVYCVDFFYSIKRKNQTQPTSAKVEKMEKQTFKLCDFLQTEKWVNFLLNRQ